MRRDILAYALVAGGALVAFIACRDARQAKQMEALTAQVTALQTTNERPQSGPTVIAYRGPTPPPSAMDPADVDRIAGRVAAMMAASAQREKSEVEASPEQRAAARQGVERAGRVLDAAEARGHLTKEDVLQIRRELALGATQEEADGIGKRVAVALNTRKIVREDPKYTMP